MRAGSGIALPRKSKNCIRKFSGIRTIDWSRAKIFWRNSQFNESLPLIWFLKLRVSQPYKLLPFESCCGPLIAHFSWGVVFFSSCDEAFLFNFLVHDQNMAGITMHGGKLSTNNYEKKIIMENGIIITIIYVRVCPCAARAHLPANLVHFCLVYFHLCDLFLSVVLILFRTVIFFSRPPHFLFRAHFFRCETVNFKENFVFPSSSWLFVYFFFTLCFSHCELRHGRVAIDEKCRHIKTQFTSGTSGVRNIHAMNIRTRLRSNASNGDGMKRQNKMNIVFCAKKKQKRKRWTKKREMGDE